MENCGNNHDEVMDPLVKIKLKTEYRQMGLRGGANTLRGPNIFNSCTHAKTGWTNFYEQRPLDYDIRNAPQWNLQNSSYRRLMDVNAPFPETTYNEYARCGAFDPHVPFIPGLYKYYRNLHVDPRGPSDYLGKDAQTNKMVFRSTTKTDYVWNKPFKRIRPLSEYDLGMVQESYHRKIQTDLHDHTNLNVQMKFNDDWGDCMNQAKLLNFKRCNNWPVNPVTDQSLAGGRFQYSGNNISTEELGAVFPNVNKENPTLNPMKTPFSPR